MIRKPIMLSALLALIFLLVPACSDEDNGTTPTMRLAGTIMGRVVDVSLKEALPSCAITITSEPFVADTSGTGKVVLKTSTDGEGMFLRDDVPNGKVTIEVKLDGYRTPEAVTWALSPGGVGEFLFELAPGEDPPEKHEGDNMSARPPDWGSEEEDE
jgi:hypothetical protein